MDMLVKGLGWSGLTYHVDFKFSITRVVRCCGCQEEPKTPPTLLFENLNFCSQENLCWGKHGHVGERSGLVWVDVPRGFQVFNHEGSSMLWLSRRTQDAPNPPF